MPPNQFNTPVVVKVYNNNTIIQTELFSDLQMAYLWIKGQMSFYTNETLRLISWEEVIRLLYEFHMTDGSGCDVLTTSDGQFSYTVFYNT